jgi:hypothetical protein
MKSNLTRASPSLYGNPYSNPSNGNEAEPVARRRVGGGMQPESLCNERRCRGQVRIVRGVSRFGRYGGPGS